MKVDEKFVPPCLPPSPYEQELLIILIEECIEVSQRATKMLRFGVEELSRVLKEIPKTMLFSGQLSASLTYPPGTELLLEEGNKDG